MEPLCLPKLSCGVEMMRRAHSSIRSLILDLDSPVVRLTYDWGLLGLTCPREADGQWKEQDGKHVIALRV